MKALTGAALIPLVVGALVVASAPANAALGCRGAWVVQASPNPGTNNQLFDVDAVAANDVWAVGSTDLPGNNGVLIVHWNGRSWTALPPLNLNPNLSIGLSTIDVLSDTDIWVAGGRSPDNTFIAHFDGMRWSVTPSPSPGSFNNFLTGLSFSSPTDGWAVGMEDYQPVGLHWDGTSWSDAGVVQPEVGEDTLRKVAAIAPDNVWAVGSTDFVADNGALIEHWDGTAWSIVPSAYSGLGDLNDLSVVSSSFIWAVGDYGNQGTPFTPRSEQWNGSSWQTVATPTTPAPDGSLSSISAPSSSSAWAVGMQWGIKFGVLVSRTLAMSWNGSAWTVVTTPNPNKAENSLASVSALSANVAWAVGYTSVHNGPSQTLILAHC